jgi:hypothetical protein
MAVAPGSGVPGKDRRRVAMKKGYTVYRVHLVTKEREAVGSMMERRLRTRSRNMSRLLAEAKTLFGENQGGGWVIVLGIEEDTPAPETNDLESWI